VITLKELKTMRGNSKFWASVWPKLDNEALIYKLRHAIENCGHQSGYPAFVSRLADILAKRVESWGQAVNYDDLYAKAKAASPGPWRNGTQERWHVFVPNNQPLAMGPERVLLRMNEHFPFEADAAYIAAASPDVVMRLIEERERFRELCSRSLVHVEMSEWPDRVRLPLVSRIKAALAGDSER
jgi:hypothetical protein